MTLYCVCRGPNGLLFLKSGDDVDDVKRRAGQSTVLTTGRCPARAVQHYFAQLGEVRGVEEKPVSDLLQKLVAQAVGWSECPSGCEHSDIQFVS